MAMIDKMLINGIVILSYMICEISINITYKPSTSNETAIPLRKRSISNGIRSIKLQ